MIVRASNWLLFALGLGLPLHGLMTVFLPDPVRWWKEGVLFLLLVLVFGSLVKNFRSEGRNVFTGYEAAGSKIKTFLSHPVLWAILFLGWGSLGVLVREDFHTSLVAFRYLGFGFFAMVLGFLLWRSVLFSGKNGYSQGVKLFHNFCTGLTLGVVLSTLIGLWAKFLGGFKILEQWYSLTISSWVPGQTIPIYHQVGDFVRLQGASSGPVEYGHLAVLAVWYVIFFKLYGVCHSLWWRSAIVILLSVGIWQSGSRAAIIGVLVLGLGFLWQQWQQRLNYKPIIWTVDKAAALLLVTIVLVSMTKFTVSKAVLGSSNFMNTNIVRVSDIDHLTRPLEAFNVALQNPIWGDLGGLGPAARAQNLERFNNDQALIAESVPFDVMAQLGFVGFALWLIFFLSFFRHATLPLRVLVIAFVPLMLLATIFDMSPVSISFFLILGLGLVLPQVRLVTAGHFDTIFNLKQLAFRKYIEAVWGWRETEQSQFVAQELDQGGVYLVSIEGIPVATFALVKEPAVTTVYSFYVHPDWQNRGLGSFVLNEVIGGRNLRLNVLKVNSSAQAFYESHGFRFEGEDEYHHLLSRLK